ncbi:MAG: phage major capsid protein [Planctomycetaceae bacterium]
MLNSKKLKEERGELDAKINDLKASWLTEERSGAATHEEIELHDKMVGEREALDLKIATAERIEVKEESKEEERSVKKFNSFAIHTGKHSWSEDLVNKGLKAKMLESLGQELTSEQRSAMEKCGFTGQRMALENRANMSVGTPGDGGHLTQQLLLDRIVDSIAQHGGLLSLVKTEVTDKGSDLRIPLADHSGRKATIRLENGPQVPTNFTFSSTVIPTYMYTDSVKCSVSLLRDSQYDIVSYITNGLGTALAVAQGEHLVNGDGTGEGLGLLQSTTAGTVTGGASSIEFEDLLDMEDSIDPAVIARGNCKWVFSPSAIRMIKGLTDLEGKPLFHPSISAGAPATVLGYPYVVDTWYEAVGTEGNIVATFGDHSYMIRRTVGDMETGIDPYTYRASEGNISYFVEQSMGCKLAVASTFHPVTHLEMGSDGS